MFQVDEFWRSSATFRNEWGYLHEARAGFETNDGTRKTDPDFDDPYKTYRQTHLAGKLSASKNFSRVDFFNVPGCNLNAKQIDRIPFAQDYGFLVCRRRPWQYAALAEETASAGDRIVNKVWDPAEGGSLRPQKSWNEFLRAACRVAEIESRERAERVPAFDLSMLAAESFSCLVLEVWLSEIYKSAMRSGQDVATRLASQVGCRDWTTTPIDGLRELLQVGTGRGLAPTTATGSFSGYSLELYKAWLLLVEAVDPSSLQNEPRAFGFRSSRLPDALAVSSRHWYKTATLAPPKGSPDPGPLTYSRLPGHFTTRGDWFLAVASGSRSDRLANRAVDLLCSQRANARRMRHGIGLPVRHLLRDPARDADKLHTALRTQPTGGKSLTYAQALALGATAADSENDFGWLWRSRLRDYHRQDFIWQGWLYRMLRVSQRLRETESVWRSGFEIYRAIDDTGQGAQIPGWVQDSGQLQAIPITVRGVDC